MESGSVHTKSHQQSRKSIISFASILADFCYRSLEWISRHFVLKKKKDKVCRVRALISIIIFCFAGYAFVSAVTCMHVTCARQILL